MPDFDNTLLGQYIKELENPYKHGYANGRWEKSPVKGDDPNNRGWGIDIKYNPKAKKLTEKRPGKWLSVQEEKNLRNQHIQYSQDVITRNYFPYLRKQPLSETKKSIATGIVYRGDGINSNKKLSDAYYNGTDDDFIKATTIFYKNKGLKSRAKANERFAPKFQQKVNPTFDWNSLPQYQPPLQFKHKGGTLVSRNSVERFKQTHKKKSSPSPSRFRSQVNYEYNPLTIIKNTT